MNTLILLTITAVIFTIFGSFVGRKHAKKINELEKDTRKDLQRAKKTAKKVAKVIKDAKK